MKIIRSTLLKALNEQISLFNDKRLRICICDRYTYVYIYSGQIIEEKP